MSPKTINEWIALAGTLAGILAALLLFGRRAWRRLCALRRLSNHGWETFFGDDPPKHLSDVLNDLAIAHDLLEARQGVIQRRLGVGLYICDSATGSCIYASPYLAEIFGVEVPAMLGFGWAAQIDDREARVHNWEWCCSRKFTYRDAYTVTNQRTGKLVRCRTEAHYIPSGGGRYVGWVEVIPDQPVTRD